MVSSPPFPFRKFASAEPMIVLPPEAPQTFSKSAMVSFRNAQLADQSPAAKSMVASEKEKLEKSIVSIPEPPSRLSNPPPPVILSFPSPPEIVSCRVSLVLARIVSPVGVPISDSKFAIVSVSMPSVAVPPVRS